MQLHLKDRVALGLVLFDFCCLLVRINELSDKLELLRFV